MKKIDVIYDDFKKSVAEYIESASSKSRTEAAEISMILMGLAKIDMYDLRKSDKQLPHALPSSFADFVGLIEDELEAAKKYADYYYDSKDESYKHLSKQELAHASFWIEKAQTIAKTPDCVQKISVFRDRHEDILQSL